MDTYLNLFQHMHIDKAGLQQAIGEDLHNVVCEKPCVVIRQDVADVLRAFVEKRVSVDALVEWVNVIWFTDLFAFADKDADCIISVFGVLETLDEEGVDVSAEELAKMIAALDANSEYEQ